jgi:hypothetical protein
MNNLLALPGSALATLALTPLRLAPFDTVTGPRVHLSAVGLATIVAASLWCTGTISGSAHLVCLTSISKFRLDIHNIGPVRQKSAMGDYSTI